MTLRSDSENPGSLGQYVFEELPQPARAEPQPPALPEGLVASLLDESTTADAAVRLEGFLRTEAPQDALAAWLRWVGWRAAPATQLDRPRLRRLLDRSIAQLDLLLSRMVNAVLHHPAFQRLEASWRGLRYLVEQAHDAERVKVRVLNLSHKELARDLERAIEFDQSQLFRLVYENEFGSPGGEPFGALVGDYEFTNHEDDLSTLSRVSGVAAAAFAPFVAAASPTLFGVDNFSSLERPMELSKIFGQLDYLKWRAFREQEDSRFVGLTAPHVLMRLPHEDDGSRIDGFCFHEDVSAPNRTGYLWGNAAYAFGAVLVRAFDRNAWLAEIRGVRRDSQAGGLVTGLPAQSFGVDHRGVAVKCGVDLIITDQLEQQLSDLGFMPLCHCKDTPFSAFYSVPSVQKAKVYDDRAASVNARMSAMLHYVLCTSRFAHYLKVIGRDKIGGFSEVADCEDYLHRWLQRYVTADAEASPAVKAELPLREARVQLTPHPRRPGSYLCVMHLWPHFELDQLSATVRLTTELSPTQSTT